MPLYQYECIGGHRTEEFFSLANHTRTIECPRCGGFADQILSAPLLVKAQPECRYASPVTGEPVTTWEKRRDDLARTGSIPYDPEMRTDYQRKAKEEEAAIDKSIDTHVEATFSKMSTKERGKLHSEVMEQGFNAEVQRVTPQL